MRFIFVDSAHLIALFSPRDRLHTAAVRVSRELVSSPDVRFVTTHLVLAELLATLSRGGENVRVAAAAFVRGFVDNPGVEVVELSSRLFERGLALYEQRPDKRYSLADCVSMVVCADMNIREVLTSDRDFEHEGYVRLLDSTP